MQRPLILKIFYVVIFAALIIGLAVYLYLNLISADSNVGENGDAKYLDFGGTHGRRQVILKMNGKDGEIGLVKSLTRSCSSKISGFEKSGKIDSLINLGENFNVIEISGLVGAHSENRQYFYLDSNSCPKPIGFVKNGNRAYNIYSDQPSFSMLDFNVDGWQDIGVEQRNYDANPILDGIREIYLYSPNSKEFVYQRLENYKQEEVCPTCNIEIK